MGATIKDVAKLSGVGIATVSRVLNNSGVTSNETKEKVMAAVRELNYVPNNNARVLKMGQSKTIALLAKSITNPFFQKMIHTIEQKVFLRGYHLEIRNVNYSEHEMSMAIKEVQDRNLNGIIIMGGNFEYTNEDFKRLGVPCVLLTVSAGDSVDSELYSSVIIDDEAESYKATEYLINLGHHRIGCIYSTHGSNVTPNLLRFRGYQKALEAYSIPYDPVLVSSINVSESGYEFGFNMMKNMMERNKDMTAVVTVADTMAIGAAKAVVSAGLRVPEDISIVGFDGIEVAEYYNPSIDTICQPAEQMSLGAIDALFGMLQGNKASHTVYEASLLKRGSCTSVSGNFRR
ncbi:LacI family DNA-binding transcriptional regulator [Anaeromicropila herbilytica]|uniref:LacI family transcriptional regulator n=1 Tax=Anaeromicropila herbilytica TaxID=2785025 RepID=A0A7R7EMN3_9FIRM|nr:LacI family DNA-binding transcriptional regulator [Anaeromicropila herbilytica]BCN31617.1 LacI family transcriptional regulator [Anaeromicropila herbilytica]